MLCWFPLGVAYGRDHNFVNAVILSWKRNANGAFGTDRQFVAAAVLWDVKYADKRNLASVVASMHPPFQTDTKVADPPPALLIVRNDLDVEYDATNEWDSKNIHHRLTIEFDVRSSMRVDCTITDEKCVEYSVKAPTTTANVF